MVYILGLLNYAQRSLPTQAEQRGSPPQKAPNNARAAAVIWDMHVFINQLIECEIYFKRIFAWV